jgi:hypothetical protein
MKSAAIVMIALAPVLTMLPAFPQQAEPASAPQARSFSQQDLDQLLAPIALYPDALLAQILMASTYPLETVSAARWCKANPGVKDKALEAEMQKRPWDPAVKPLTSVPKVLEQMSEQLEWTQKLGDAFLAQQKEVMSAVQALRAKAAAAGNLKTTPEQTVKTEQQGSTGAIQTLYAIVDAQRIYAATDADGNGMPDYAARFISTPDKKDGLYWDASAGGESPLGPLVGAATAQGYSAKGSGKPQPYYGYLYRIITAQGKDARGGAYDYRVNGRLFGGFAVVAYPARYDVSGVKTFMVNHEGVVYEKDFGPATGSRAAAMGVYDPDRSWQKSQ